MPKAQLIEFQIADPPRGIWTRKGVTWSDDQGGAIVVSFSPPRLNEREKVDVCTTTKTEVEKRVGFQVIGEVEISKYLEKKLTHLLLHVTP